LGLDLLVKHSEGDIFEEGKRADLFVEQHLLIDYIDQVTILDILNIGLARDLVGHPLRECWLLLFTQGGVSPEVVLGEHLVYLATLHHLDCVSE
jgi:hypothetical protein